MTIYRCLLIFFILLLPALAPAQDMSYEMSKPVKLDLVGVNKVLCMRNGNTMLFHFEPSRGITIMVFDSTRRQIASRKELCRFLDVYLIQDAEFKGLYDINGEAVLFMDQANNVGRHCLIRLRFNATNASLIEEKLVAESKNLDKRMKFFVMKQKDHDDYAVLFSTTKNYPKTCDIYTVSFNARHEAQQEVQLEVDRKAYDFVEIAGADMVHDGLLISLAEYKLLLNGTISHESEFDPTNNEYRHHLELCYLPAGGTSFIRKKVDLSPDVYPFHSYCSYNPFSGSINLLHLGYKDAVIKYGLELLPTAVMDNLFLRLDQNTLDLSPAWINNTLANQYLKQKTDTSRFFKGVPLGIITNENGLSTMVSEAFVRYANVETQARPTVYETYLTNICITQFDDDGKELWGAVLPKMQYYKSYEHYYYANQLQARWHQQSLLLDRPEQVYERQFVSLNTCTKKHDHFVIFNDATENFNNSLSHPGDTVYLFGKTSAVCYKISSKKEITKHYVFGHPQHNEYKCSFIEGADYDEKRGIYAALVQYTKGENTTLNMAWSHLE
jgi:hypothetical protein